MIKSTQTVSQLLNSFKIDFSFNTEAIYEYISAQMAGYEAKRQTQIELYGKTDMPRLCASVNHTAAKIYKTFMAKWHKKETKMGEVKFTHSYIKDSFWDCGTRLSLMTIRRHINLLVQMTDHGFGFITNKSKEVIELIDRACNGIKLSIDLNSIYFKDPRANEALLAKGQDLKPTSEPKQATNPLPTPKPIALIIEAVSELGEKMGTRLSKLQHLQFPF